MISGGPYAAVPITRRSPGHAHVKAPRQIAHPSLTPPRPGRTRAQPVTSAMTARRSLARPGMRAWNRSSRPVTKLPGTVARRRIADCPRQDALAGCRSPSRSHGERTVTSHLLRVCRGDRICRAVVVGRCGWLLRSVSPAHAAWRLVPATDRIGAVVGRRSGAFECDYVRVVSAGPELASAARGQAARAARPVGAVGGRGSQNGTMVVSRPAGCPRPARVRQNPTASSDMCSVPGRSGSRLYVPPAGPVRLSTKGLPWRRAHSATTSATMRPSWPVASGVGGVVWFSWLVSGWCWSSVRA
jgi:hypothetical protein